MRYRVIVSRPIATVALTLLLAASVAAQPKTPAPATEEQKAREAFLAGKVDDAFKLLQGAAKANPAVAPPKVTLSKWFLEAGRGEQARLLLEQAAADEPNHPEVLLTNASFALNELRITDTILSCTAAIQAADSPRWGAEAKKRFQRDARLGLTAAYEARGDHASAKTHLATLLEGDPRNAGLRQRLGRANFLLSRHDEAFAEFKAAFKDDPTVDPPELAVAQLWTGKQDFVRADEWYGKAATAHENSAKVHRAVAGYSLDRGQFDKAKVHIAAAQKLEPVSRETKALGGLLARYGKDYATATTVFEELVKEHPSFAFATVNLALVLAESGDATGKRRAVELAEGHTRQNQRQSEARVVLAYCLFKAGRTADAEKVARSALELGPMTLDGTYFFAKVLSAGDAIEEAHRAVKLACEGKGAFVYRKEAEALLAELEKKLPPPKK